MKLGQRSLDEEGVEHLLLSFKPRARAITASFRIPPEDGEDLLQEALLTFLHKRDEIFCPEAWLAATLKRRCLMYWRSRRRNLLRQVDASILELLAGGEEGPQQSIDARCDLDRLLCEVPEKCRSLLVARYREGLTPSETAQSLGYRRSGIYKLIERCLSALTTRVTMVSEKNL